MNLFNQYSLPVMGIMFEIIGSFFLTLEAFGSNWTDIFFKKIIQFSNWTKRSLFRLLIISFIFLLPFITAILFESKILIALFLPISFLILLSSTLIDDAQNLKKWTIIIINKKKISPIGFIMLLIGNILQLIAIIIQIK